MKDILGREIEQGDLVVIKPTVRNSSGLDIGVLNGKSVRFKNGKNASYDQFFKICNPNDEESKIRDKILLDISSENEKRKSKTIAVKDLEVGRLYLNKSGNKEYYLGKGEFKKYSSYEDQEWKEYTYGIKTNSGFICVDYSSYVEDQDINYDTLYGIKARKTNPQFIEALEMKLDINTETIELLSDTGRWKYKLNLKLYNQNK